MQYKLFCDPTYKKCVNSMYVTEDEIMKEIENAYDYSFVEFYLNRYKDNDGYLYINYAFENTFG
jgi:hypothetical protein